MLDHVESEQQNETLQGLKTKTYSKFYIRYPPIALLGGTKTIAAGITALDVQKYP